MTRLLKVMAVLIFASVTFGSGVPISASWCVKCFLMFSCPGPPGPQGTSHSKVSASTRQSVLTACIISELPPCALWPKPSKPGSSLVQSLSLQESLRPPDNYLAFSEIDQSSAESWSSCEIRTRVLQVGKSLQGTPLMNKGKI